MASCVVYLFLLFLSGNKLYSNTAGMNKEIFSGENFHYGEQFRGNNIVESYNTFTTTYALSFGNDFAKWRYGGLLRSMYPHFFSYDIWGKQFYHFGRRVSFEEIASDRPVMIRGTNLTGGYADDLVLGEKIASFPEGDRIYELLGVKP